MAFENKGAMAATVVVAASDSLNKAAANYVCDGVADNVEVQAAVSALLGGSGRVLLLDGNYSFSATVAVPSNTTIQGSGWGTIIKMADGANLGGLFSTTSKLKVTYKDMNLDGNGDNQTGPASVTLIGASEGTDITAENIYAHDSYRSGIYWGGAKNCLIKSCWAVNNGRGAVGVGFGLNESGTRPSTNCKIVDCHSQSNIEAGYSIFGLSRRTGPRNCSIVNCTAETEPKAGISCYNSQQCSIIGCHIYNSTLQGIQLAACEGFKVFGNTIDTTGATGNGMYIVTLSGVGCTDNLIVGNVIRYASYPGININDAACEGNVVIGNTIVNCGHRGILCSAAHNIIVGNTVSHNSRDGIVINGVKYCVVKGNNCANNSQAGASTYAGILLTGTAMYNEVGGNTCSDNQLLDTSLLTATAAAGQKIVTVASTASFVPGQWVTISDLTPLTENNQIDTVDSSTQLTMKTNLTNTYTVAQSGVVTGRATQKYGIREAAAADNYNLVIDNICYNNITAPISTQGANTVVKSNIGYIAPGEIRSIAGSLVAGIANAFTFAWQNPEGQAVTIIELMVDITTAGGTAGSVLDAGSAVDATTHGDDLINDGDLNAIGILVSTARVKLAANGGATDWLTGQILTANASLLAGKYYVTYMGQ